MGLAIIFFAIFPEQQPEPDLLVTETDELVEAILSLSSKPYSNFGKQQFIQI
jgi:hypothetical protein